MNKVDIRHLSKSYPTFALKDVSFSIPKGYVTGFIGRNGMGKTTTIKSLLSLLHYQGQIDIDGKNIQDLAYQQDIGLVMDEPFLAKDWKIDQINQAMAIGYDRWDQDLFYRHIKRFHIDTQLKVQELSRGMKIKVMLAIALSHHATLLILDEPTSGLDPEMRDEFSDLIQDFMRDETHTVLFSTHITQDLEAIADYIVFIDQGRLVLAAGKEEFMATFMVLKGRSDQVDQIPPTAILGVKKQAVACQVLIRRQDLPTIPGDFVEDRVTIDDIMILYGRSDRR